MIRNLLFKESRNAVWHQKDDRGRAASLILPDSAIAKQLHSDNLWVILGVNQGHPV